jgi:hypothetical protein
MDNQYNHLKTLETLSRIPKDMFIIQYCLLLLLLLLLFDLTPTSTFEICYAFPQLKPLLPLLDMIGLFMAFHQSSKLDFPLSVGNFYFWLSYSLSQSFPGCPQSRVFSIFNPFLIFGLLFLTFSLPLILLFLIRLEIFI